MSKRYRLYSDGGCKKPGGIGAWGVVIESPAGTHTEYSGFDPETTNNRMELMGAIRAVEGIPEEVDAELTSDSQYVVRGMNEWIEGWAKKGWKKSTGKAVINLDLWVRLRRSSSRRKMIFSWTKGHDGHAQNERCDQLCNQEMDRRIEKKN